MTELAGEICVGRSFQGLRAMTVNALTSSMVLRFSAGLERTRPLPEDLAVCSGACVTKRSEM